MRLLERGKHPAEVLLLGDQRLEASTPRIHGLTAILSVTICYFCNMSVSLVLSLF